MAWTATIVNKGVVEKSFLVGVSYSNGTLQFVETMDMTGGSLQTLNDRVVSRLATLETTQSLIPQVSVGAFVPLAAVVATPLQSFIVKYGILQSAIRASDLGLIQKTDPAYVTALADAQAAFDPSFIGKF